MRLALAAVLALPVAAAAQTVWNVAPPDIQAVINQASPGDVLVLTPTGSSVDYRGFTLDKGLTIRGNGAKIGGTAGGTSADYAIAIAVPSGQVAHIDHIDTSYSYAPWGTVGCRVVVTSGSVRFEDCLLRSDSALKISNAQVVVTGGSVIGWTTPNPGTFAIEATNSHLSVRHCLVTGNGSSCSYPFCSTVRPARTAITAIGSVLHMEGVTVQGGSQQGSLASPGAPAVDLQSSIAYFTDCSLTGGNGTVGAAALVNNGVAAELRNTTLTGGSPGGQASSGLVVVNNALTALEIAPPWQRGVTSFMTISAEPSAPFVLFFTPATASGTLSLVVEPVWDAGAVACVYGVLDPQGLAVLSLPLPNNPAIQHATLWFQVASGSSFPLRASTIAGGVVR